MQTLHSLCGLTCGLSQKILSNTDHGLLPEQRGVTASRILDEGYTELRKILLNLHSEDDIQAAQRITAKHPHTEGPLSSHPSLFPRMSTELSNMTLSVLQMEAGILTLTSFISPYERDRQAVRARMPPGDFIEVHMNVSPRFPLGLQMCGK